jgi:putative sigma-54 modulation protein
MEINIKAIHFDISEKLVEFVNKKIEKLLRRFEAISNADINLTLVKPETAKNKEAGIKLSIPGQQDLFASKTADSFEEAVDLALAALEPQLEKAKEKK